MAIPLPPLPATSRSSSRRLAFAGLAAGLLAGLLACARPEEVTISPAKYDRDRAARADLAASIAADHEGLADLIGSDRFALPSAIYSDPELRTIAARLIENSRELERLADTDVLAPGAP